VGWEANRREFELDRFSDRLRAVWLSQAPPVARYPNTVVGRWLEASVAREPTEVRKRLGKRLNGGEPGFNADEPAVAAAASLLAVRKLAGDNPTDEQIAEFASDAAEKFSERVHPDEAKLVLTGLLRGQTSESRAVKIDHRFTIHMAVFFTACFRLRPTESDLRLLLADAERIAVAKGYKPPPISDDL
jgi:hypothetical protein